MWRLDDAAVRMLIQAPESGMGYQIVRAVVDGEERSVFVFASRLSVAVDDVRPMYPSLMQRHIETAAVARGFRLQSVITVADFAAGRGGQVRPHGDALAAAPRVTSRTNDKPVAFVRYTSTLDDPRIGQSGAVAPATYMTTIADSHLVPSGLAAAGRYALPNPAPAVFVRLIIPYADTPYVLGTVRPAFGQAGGGVEALFHDGAPIKSAFRPYMIPEG